MVFTVSYETFKAARTVFGQRLVTFYVEDDQGNFRVVATAEGQYFTYSFRGPKPATFATDFPNSIRVLDIEG